MPCISILSTKPAAELSKAIDTLQPLLLSFGCQHGSRTSDHHHRLFGEWKNDPHPESHPAVAQNIPGSCEHAPEVLAESTPFFRRS
jgi:hypothetical protein